MAPFRVYEFILLFVMFVRSIGFAYVVMAESEGLRIFFLSDRFPFNTGKKATCRKYSAVYTLYRHALY
jgi:hypothetical protein